MHISAVSVLVAALLASAGVEGARGAGVAHPMNAGSRHASNGASHILHRRSESGSSEGDAPAPTQTPFNNRKPGKFGDRVKPAPVEPAAPAKSESGDSSETGGGSRPAPVPAPGVNESESSESGDSSHEGGGSGGVPNPPGKESTKTTTTTTMKETTTTTTTTSNTGKETTTTTAKADGTSTKASGSSTVKVESATASPSAPPSDASRSTEGGNSGSPGFNPAWAVAPAAVAGAAGLFLYRRRRANDAGTMEWPEEGVQKNALYEDTATHENALYADNLQG